MRLYFSTFRRHLAPEFITALVFFLCIVIGSWFVVPAPRWALVTIGASATLLIFVIIAAVFSVPPQMTAAGTIAAFIGHVVSLTLILETAPTLSVGDPPGRLLSSIAIQSPDHAIRYRVPFPRKSGDRVRVKLVLAQPYAGMVRLRIDISGRSNGVMQTPLGGNLGELEYVFDTDLFHIEKTILVTLQQDTYDPNLRLATWKSGLGRQLVDEPEYLTEYQVFRGLPDPLTGAMTRAWPLIWVTNI